MGRITEYVASRLFITCGLIYKRALKSSYVARYERREDRLTSPKERPRRGLGQLTSIAELTHPAEMLRHHADLTPSESR